MKTRSKPDQNHLAEFLQSEQADTYFGPTFVIRADVLAHVLTGDGTLSAIAAKHGVSKAAMTRHARRAREIFGGKHAVDLGQ